MEKKKMVPIYSIKDYRNAIVKSKNGDYNFILYNDLSFYDSSKNTFFDEDGGTVLKIKKKRYYLEKKMYYLKKKKTREKKERIIKKKKIYKEK